MQDNAPNEVAPTPDYWSMLFVLVLATFIGLGVILPGVAAAAHAADVADQRHLGHRRGRRDHRRPARTIPLPIRVLGAIALFASMTNIVSGFLITDRMLKMFKQPASRQQSVTGTAVQLAYLAATVLFIFSLHWMNDPKTARRGVCAGVAAMVLAVLATWIQPEIVHHGWIVLAIVAGFAVGVPLSRVPLTAVPQRTALSHAFGGLAAGLVGTAKYYLWLGQRAPEQLTPFRMAAHRRRGDPRVPDASPAA